MTLCANYCEVKFLFYLDILFKVDMKFVVRDFIILFSNMDPKICANLSSIIFMVQLIETLENLMNCDDPKHSRK